MKLSVAAKLKTDGAIESIWGRQPGSTSPSPEFAGN